MMTAKRKSEFVKAKKTINKKYSRYISAAKPVLNLKRDVYFISDPRKYNGSHGPKLPTIRKRLAREKIL